TRFITTADLVAARPGDLARVAARLAVVVANAPIRPHGSGPLPGAVLVATVFADQPHPPLVWQARHLRGIGSLPPRRRASRKGPAVWPSRRGSLPGPRRP